MISRLTLIGFLLHNLTRFVFVFGKITRCICTVYQQTNWRETRYCKLLACDIHIRKSGNPHSVTSDFITSSHCSRILVYYRSYKKYLDNIF